MSLIPPLLIRPSSLPTYADCARRAMSRMIPSQIADWGYQLNTTPRHVGAAVGTAVHAGVATVLSDKMKSGEARVSAEAIDRATSSLMDDVGRIGVAWDDVTPAGETAMRQVDRMVRVYTATTGQIVKPVAVEQHLVLETRNGNRLQGTLDLATDGVRDLKTGKFQTGNIAQYGAYSLLVRGNGGESAFVAEDYMKRVPLALPQPDPVETRYESAIAEAVAAKMVRRVEADYQEFMETGDPMAFQANPNSVLCGARFCPAWGTKFCQEHRK